MNALAEPSSVAPHDKMRQWREHPVSFVRDVFGVTPDAWQANALEAFPHCPRLAMKACAGPGKAQPVDMVIETPAGTKRWGDLKVGDFVFAEDGSPTVVRSVHDLGNRSVFRVSFDDGTSTLACDEHLWKVRGRTERRHFKSRTSPAWRLAKERQAIAQGWPVTPADGYAILSTAEIIARNNSPDGQRRQFEIPTQGPVQFAHAALPVDAYVLGVWLGDGGAGSPRGSWRDIEIDDEIVQRGYAVNRSADGKSAWVRGLASGLRNLGVFKLRSYEKFVPAQYLRASSAQRLDVLCGLMDTDGTIGADNSMSFDVTSERLVRDVEWLVRSLGGVAVRRKTKNAYYRDEDGDKVDCRPCYRVTVTLPMCPFKLSRKASRWSPPQARYLTRYIDCIEPEGMTEVRCIEIDHPSHCYLANDFIVTHNTAVLAWVAWNFLLTRKHPVIGATSISGANLKSGLWTELSRWYAKSPLLQAKFEVTGSKIFLREHPETWKLEARTWAADANAEQIGNALAGLHARHIMWLLDETGDYPMAVLPVCEGIFNGAPAEAHIIQAGNPTRREGPLYHACTTARNLWHVVSITADPDDPERTPRVSIEVARQQIAQYGADNPWVLVRIFGQFPSSSFNALIGPDEVEAAFERRYQESDILRQPRILGVDVAREGDDKSVIFPRQGLVAFKPHEMRNATSDQGAGQIARVWADWDVNACFIDNTGGFGAGWIDQLRLLKREPIGVGFAEKAEDPRYYNRRAEMYFRAVTWIKGGGMLPKLPDIVAELTQTTYTFKRDRLLLEPKEAIKAKIGRSPDLADGLALTFAATVAPREAKQVLPMLRAREETYDPFEPYLRN